MKLFTLSLFACFLLQGCNHRSFPVAENGEPQAAIVVGEKPVKAAKFAAAELQHVIKMVTGATLPIVATRPEDGCAFYVGCDAGGDAAVRGKPFEKEEYLVAFRGRDCYLCGHDAADYSRFDYTDEKTLPDILYCYRSTSYAVYDFLEKHVGVRFYGFGDQGIAFEPKSMLTVTGAPDVRRAPAMDAYRRPYFGSRCKTQLNLSDRDAKLLQLRWRANCMFGEVNHSVMGIWYRYYAPSKVESRAKHFIESRPDYFAQGYKGKNAPNSLRKWDYPGDVNLPPQLCTSAEGPVEYFADEAARMFHGEDISGTFASRPVMGGQPFYYPVQEQDSGAWCLCETCQKNPKLKSYLYRHFDWVNRIARAAKAKDPKLGIGTLAYSDTLNFPEGMEIEDNVLVQMCIGPQSWFHPYTYQRQHDGYKSWVTREGKKRPLTVWLYYLCPWAEAQDVHKYGKFFPIIYPRHNGKFFKEFAGDGIRGFFAEITPRYHLLEAYMNAKIADDPTIDPEALLDEHYRLYYGAAGQAMKTFCDTFEAESYDIKNYSDAVKSMRIGGSYIYRFHAERDNWFLGSVERVKRLDALMDAVKAAAVTPLEKARVQDYCDRIWNTAVEGRKEFEEREGVRAIPIPYVAPAWRGECGGDLGKVDFTKARKASVFRDLFNQSAPYTAEIKAANDSTHLYFEYAERGGDAAAHPDLDGWSNGIEVFLGTVREKDYLQFCISPSGEIKAHRVVIVEGAQRTEPVKLPAAVTMCGKEGWTLRFAVPFAEIPHDAKAGEYLYGNVFRTRRWDGGVSTVWSPIFSERYLSGLHRFGAIYTTAATQYGAFKVDAEGWTQSDTKGGLKSGEEFSFKDGILKLKSGEKKLPFYALQQRPFPAIHAGDKVVFEFEARGESKDGWKGSCCLFQLTGRAYGAGLVRDDFPVIGEWTRHRVVLTAEDQNPKNPVTVFRPGFGVYNGGWLEVRNLAIKISSE